MIAQSSAHYAIIPVLCVPGNVGVIGAIQGEHNSPMSCHHFHSSRRRHRREDMYTEYEVPGPVTPRLHHHPVVTFIIVFTVIVSQHLHSISTTAQHVFVAAAMPTLARRLGARGACDTAPGHDSRVGKPRCRRASVKRGGGSEHSRAGRAERRTSAGSAAVRRRHIGGGSPQAHDDVRPLALQSAKGSTGRTSAAVCWGSREERR